MDMNFLIDITFNHSHEDGPLAWSSCQSEVSWNNWEENGDQIRIVCHWKSTLVKDFPGEYKMVVNYHLLGFWSWRVWITIKIDIELLTLEDLSVTNCPNLKEISMATLNLPFLTLKSLSFFISFTEYSKVYNPRDWQLHKIWRLETMGS